MFEKLRISGGGRPTPLHHQTVFVPVRMLGTLPRDEVTSPTSPHRVCRSMREDPSTFLGDQQKGQGRLLPVSFTLILLYCVVGTARKPWWFHIVESFSTVAATCAQQLFLTPSGFPSLSAGGQGVKVGQQRRFLLSFHPPLCSLYYLSVHKPKPALFGI